MKTVVAVLSNCNCSSDANMIAEPSALTVGEIPNLGPCRLTNQKMGTDYTRRGEANLADAALQ